MFTGLNRLRSTITSDLSTCLLKCESDLSRKESRKMIKGDLASTWYQGPSWSQGPRIFVGDWADFEQF